MPGEGAPIDKALCEYLKRYRRGQESAASSKEWSRVPRQGDGAGAAVNRLRCDGHPICSDATGYFYAARQSEVRATVAHPTHRAHFQNCRRHQGAAEIL